MKPLYIEVTPGEHAELKGFAAAMRQSMSRLFGGELRRMLERFKKDRKADPTSLALERRVAVLEKENAELRGEK